MKQGYHTPPKNQTKPAARKGEGSEQGKEPSMVEIIDQFILETIPAAG